MRSTIGLKCVAITTSVLIYTDKHKHSFVSGQQLFARKKAKLSQNRLADLLDISQTIISRLENGHDKSSAYTAQFAQNCGVPASWLATGKIGANLYKIEPQSIDAAEQTYNNEPKIIVWDQLRSKAGGVERFKFVYDGDSMAPVIPGGAVLWVDPSKTPINGVSIILADINDSPVIGIFSNIAGGIYARPANPQYPAISINHADIIGVVYKYEVLIP